MNKEEIEKYKIIKFLEENRQNKYGFIEMDCKDVCVLLDYINQLETNRDEAIEYIKNHIHQETYTGYMDAKELMKLVSLLERGKE